MWKHAASRDEKDVLSSQQYKNLYRELRQKREVDPITAGGNYKPKSLLDVSPESCVSSVYPQLAEKRRDVGKSLLDEPAKERASPRKVLKGNNVFLIGDKHDFITLEPTENGDAKSRTARHDRNNNSDGALGRDVPENAHTNGEVTDLNGSFTSVSATVHNIEINTDLLVPYPDYGTADHAPVSISHDYADGDFSRYLEDETDAAMHKYPVIRPQPRKADQYRIPDKSNNSRTTLRGIFEKKSPNNLPNGVHKVNPNTVRDISFTDSKLGLAYYANNRPRNYSENETRSFGSTDADNFVHSQFTYEKYLQSRCIERMNNGEMDAASTNKLLVSIDAERERQSRYKSAFDLTELAKTRALSHNVNGNIDVYQRRKSPWKKFTMRFRSGQSVDEVESPGLYTTLPR